MPKGWLTQGRFSLATRFAAFAVVDVYVETIYRNFKTFAI